MDLFWHLIIGVVVSFVGSIPPGSINIQVIFTSLSQGSKPAILFSIGAAIIEIIYCAIAIYFSNYIISSIWLIQYIQIISLPVLAALAYYYLKSNKLNTVTERNQTVKRHFLQGGLMGFVNPFQIPFWVTYFSLLISNNWIRSTQINNILFVCGVGLGGFLFHVLLIILVKNFKHAIISVPQQLKKIVGYIFIVLFVVQLIQVLAS